MTVSLNFKSAASRSLEELAAYFTTAFAGYFYPQQLTSAALARRVRQEQIDLHHSLLAFDGAEFVGIALLALRVERGWCAGFGIVKERRGQGFATELMKRFVEQARDCGVKRLSLEVLARNTAARRLYERAGLKVTRDLLILERRGETSQPETEKDLKEAEANLLLRHFVSLHTEQPAWQRELPALLAADGPRGLCLGDKQAPAAYGLLITRPDGGTNLIDLAAADEESAKALSAGINKLPGALRVVNEPENSLFIPALLANGFVETDRQYEMACEL